jgi:RNA polymerase sigma factor (sigma-70 family)
MQLRSAKKMDVVSMDDVMENTFILHPDDEHKEETMKQLERCMEKLPAAQKESVNLFYYDEKCYKEIAEQTGYTLKRGKKLYTKRQTQLKNLPGKKQ